LRDSDQSYDRVPHVPRDGILQTMSNFNLRSPIE
jgi:hypothetical protein